MKHPKQIRTRATGGTRWREGVKYGCLRIRKIRVWYFELIWLYGRFDENQRVSIHDVLPGRRLVERGQICLRGRHRMQPNETYNETVQNTDMSFIRYDCFPRSVVIAVAIRPERVDYRKATQWQKQNKGIGLLQAPFCKILRCYPVRSMITINVTFVLSVSIPSPLRSVRSRLSEQTLLPPAEIGKPEIRAAVRKSNLGKLLRVEGCKGLGTY